MKTILSPRRDHYLAKFSIFLITVALIAGMVGGCDGQYNLTISSTVGGNVTIPGEGTFNYTAGALVPLLATPDEGYRFVNWYGDVGTIADRNDAGTNIKVEGRYSITANFTEIREYHLTVSATVGGWVITPGVGTFPYDGGTVVNLVVEAEEGYGFANWTGDVSAIDDVNAATTAITMNGNYSITANFEEEKAVTITDPNLETAIRAAIGIPEDTIYPSDLKEIEELEASGQGITDLTGLEYCTGLTELYLYANQIDDISPVANLTSLGELYLSGSQISDISSLANLTSLRELYLSGNQISDISSLASLTSMTELNLSGNQISDISSLANLTSLTYLSLSSNQIRDISPLASLTSLGDLSLGGNQIRDISPLANLTSLTLLNLSDNQISDIEPLVDNPGLSQGDKVYLLNNPLSSSSTITYIPQLEVRGVTVEY